MPPQAAPHRTPQRARLWNFSLIFFWASIEIPLGEVAFRSLQPSNNLDRKIKQFRMHHSVIKPNSWVALKLPSGVTRVIQVTPNTYVNQRGQ